MHAGQSVSLIAPQNDLLKETEECYSGNSHEIRALKVVITFRFMHLI